MVENLFEIYLGDSSVNLIEDAKKISPQLAGDLKKIAVNAITETGGLALDAIKSATPWFTKELKDTLIQKSNPSPTAKIPQSTVYVLQVAHFGADQKPIPAGQLMDLLNIGVGPRGKLMKRSHPSEAVNGFPSYSGYTKNFIEKAENNFNNRLSRLLNKDFNY